MTNTAPFAENPVEISIIGTEDTGKTALIDRFVNDEYTPEHKPIAGSDLVKSKVLDIDEQSVNLKLREIKNLQSEKSLGDAVIITFDPQNKASIAAAKKTFAEIKEGRFGQPRVCFAATRADQTNRTMAQNICNDIKKSTGSDVVSVSAKSGLNVNNLFINLTTKVLRASGPTPTAAKAKVMPVNQPAPTQNAQTSLNQIWSNPNLQTTEQKTLAILNDYTKGGTFTRFLRGDWQRDNINNISALVEDAENNQMTTQEILNKLKKMELKKPDEALEKAIEYINSQASEEKDVNQPPVK